MYIGVGLVDKGGVVDRGVACGSVQTKLCKQIYLIRSFLLPTLMCLHDKSKLVGSPCLLSVVYTCCPLPGHSLPCRFGNSY